MARPLGLGRQVRLRNAELKIDDVARDRSALSVRRRSSIVELFTTGRRDDDRDREQDRAGATH